MYGEYEDYYIHPDGTRELAGHGKNLIVNTAYVVLALAMKQDLTVSGLLYWAVGDGGYGTSGANSTTWDGLVTAGTVKAQATDTKLIRETFRKQILPSDIVFVDALGAPSAAPTNRLQLTVLLDYNEPSGGGTLREFGLVGGSTAVLSASNPFPVSSQLNSGYLINHKVHKTYGKLTSVQLERKLILTF